MSQLAVPRSESTHQRLYEFARTALVKILAHTYATVCELYCGGGLHADKWAEAQIGHYMGIDSGITQIREAWESERKANTAEFFELDPCLREWQGASWREDEKSGHTEPPVSLGKINDQKGILGPGPADLRFSEALLTWLETSKRDVDGKGKHQDVVLGSKFI